MTIASFIWRQLEAVGHARAQHELRHLADRWALTHPALAQQIREASLREPEPDASTNPPTAGTARPAPTSTLLQRR
jgi:hypothetical protein